MTELIVNYNVQINLSNTIMESLAYVIPVIGFDIGEENPDAREKVLREFDSKVVGQKYIKLYKEILNG